jgi:inhibitor of KinA
MGDAALLVRFSEVVSDEASRAAVAFASRLTADPPEGVEEIAPGLVSVLLRLKDGVDRRRLGGELMLLMGAAEPPPAASHRLAVSYDGEDIAEVAERLRLERDEFIALHSVRLLRVLATGFAPGFVYCGFHDAELVLPRREHVRPLVEAGTVLFAAGQTAIAATPIRTGWHILGRTAFQNFDALAAPPTRLAAGDLIRFEAVL